MGEELLWQHVLKALKPSQARLSVSTINNLAPVPTLPQMTQLQPTGRKLGGLQEQQEEPYQPSKSENYISPENTKQQSSFQCCFNGTNCRGAI